LDWSKYAGSIHGNSHGDKKLVDHLEGVWRLARSIAAQHGIEVDLETLCLTHDLAKNHPQFQRHLQNPRVRFPHAEPSAFFTLKETGDLLEAEIVRRHHSQLENVDLAQSFWNGLGREETDKRMGQILPVEKWDPGNWKKVQSRILMFQPTLEDWLNTRAKCSLFVTADRLDAMNIPGISFHKLTAEHSVDSVVRTLPPTPLSKWREGLRQDVLRSIPRIQQPGINVLTLPSGAGKTLMALEIAEKLQPFSLVYVLPFISIVEQNVRVARQIFDNVQEDHSLVSHDGNEKEGCGIGRFIRAFRYWDSSIVFTTMVHFWDVLYSPRVNDCMNFHRLKNAFVVLDEVQAIPPSLWQGFVETLAFLAQNWQTTFLLLTATQPLISDVTPLVPPATIPRSRQQFRFLGDVPIQDLPDQLPGKGKGLVVMNTRKSALKAYELCQHIVGKDTTFLSRWVIPKHRRERVQSQKAMVATQVVEAGMDLDFDWVFRDLAPLDSIVQAGGRCNRNFRNSHGQVIVARLLDDAGLPFCSRVYEKTLLVETLKVLPETFSERDIPGLLAQYFQGVLQVVSRQGPWEELKVGNWGEWFPLVRKKLPEATVIVDVNGETASLFEQLQQMEKDLENLDQRKRIWRALQQWMIEVPVQEMEGWIAKTQSIFVDGDRPSVEILSPGLYRVNPEGIGTVYKLETGFVPCMGEDDGDGW